MRTIERVSPVILWVVVSSISLCLLVAAGGGHPPASQPSGVKDKAPASLPTAPTSQPQAALDKSVPRPPVVVQGVSGHVLLYTGGLRSYFEPCGCQADMLGGLGRLATLYAGYRRLGLQVLPVDAGNLYFEELTTSQAKYVQNEVKANMVADLFRHLGVRAVGVGPHDLTYGLAHLRGLIKRSGIPTISSNIVDQKTGKAIFPTHHILTFSGKKIGLFSITDTPPKIPGAQTDHAHAFPKDFWASRGLRILPTEATAKREVQALKAKGVDMIIMLSTLGIDRAAAIVRNVKGIDFAVDGHDEDGIDPPQSQGDGWVLSTPKEGQKAGVFAMFLRPKTEGWAPIQTPASLREQIKQAHQQIASYHQQAKQMEAQGEAFKPIAAVYRNQAAALVKDIAAMAQRLSLPPQLPSGKNGYYHALVSLTKFLPDHPFVERRVARYLEEAKEANLRALQKIKPILTNAEGNSYIGVERCRTCHISQYLFWKKTLHSHAYATLEKKKKQFDLDCIGCHVVGWQKPGGLYRIQNPKRLANVQCENCHQHGAIHSLNPLTKKGQIHRQVPASVCTGCHQGSHDPKFNYVEKLKKILGKGHGEKRLAQLLKENGGK